MHAKKQKLMQLLYAMVNKASGVNRERVRPTTTSHNMAAILQLLDRFSNRTGTAFEDGISRGIVWTRLPVSLLTSSGQVHVTFTTAFSVFSRREDNAKGSEARQSRVFCLYFSWKR